MYDYSHNQMLSELSCERLLELLKETQLNFLNEKYAENNRKDANYDEENQEQVMALRQLYPELLELNNATLYDIYDSYMSDCEYIGGWGVPDRRTNLFIYYVIGRNANYKLEGYDAQEFGKQYIIELLKEEREC